MVRVRTGLSQNKVRAQLVWFVAWLFVTAFGLVLSPSSTLQGTHQQLGLPACPSVAFFDRPCFGCGLTTSVSATLHLDFVTAWKAHPFGAPLYVALTVTAISCLWAWRRGLFLDTDTSLFSRTTMAVAVAIVVFGALRFASVKYGSEEFRKTQIALGLSRGEQGR